MNWEFEFERYLQQVEERLGWRLNEYQIDNLMRKFKYYYFRNGGPNDDGFSDATTTKPKKVDNTMVLKCKDNTGMELNFTAGLDYAGENYDSEFYLVEDDIGQKKTVLKERFIIKGGL